uniref:Uncharacterized protein n=1 Tax=Arion vulgaris TaxID=1028688 RepID=A0A0B6YAH4_9EUPU
MLLKEINLCRKLINMKNRQLSLGSRAHGDNRQTQWGMRQEYDREREFCIEMSTFKLIASADVLGDP